MYNKTVIRFSFCDIQNNQGVSYCYQPQPLALADDTYLDLDYSGYHKNLIQQLFISPLQNTISAIVFESRETLLWIALYLSFLRETVFTKYCLQVLLLLSSMCFLFAVF